MEWFFFVFVVCLFVCGFFFQGKGGWFTDLLFAALSEGEMASEDNRLELNKAGQREISDYGKMRHSW